MTTDLTMLVWTTALYLLFPPVLLGVLSATPGGLTWGTGNRAEPFALPPWAERLQRAHRNLLESLPPFAALVVVAHLSGRANAATALGATIFFWARVVHAGSYVAGVPYVRSIAFATGTLSLVLILVQLVR